MKSLLLVITLLFSFSIFANEANLQPELCWSHGQCQSNQPVTGVKCFIVKLGHNPDGSLACSLRCSSMLMGSYCEPVQAHAFGICKTENFPIPSFDPNDCSKAVDPDELP